MLFETKIRPANPQGNEIEQLEWLWPKNDGGAWEGPMENWVSDHSKKLFKYIKNYDLVIQAGGCCGMYPRLLAERFKWVYTFEPNPIPFHCLVNNNQLLNVVKIQAALGERIGMVTNKEGAESGNIGANVTTRVDHASIPSLTIDTFEFPQCDLIMLDVEGNERHIINGARKTIDKFHPVICLEAHGTQQATSILDEIGYHQREQCVADLIYTFDK